MIHIALVPLGTCFVCERREADRSVSVDGDIREICSTCFERAEDERGGNDRG